MGRRSAHVLICGTSVGARAACRRQKAFKWVSEWRPRTGFASTKIDSVKSVVFLCQRNLQDKACMPDRQSFRSRKSAQGICSRGIGMRAAKALRGDDNSIHERWVQKLMNAVKSVGGVCLHSALLIMSCGALADALLRRAFRFGPCSIMTTKARKTTNANCTHSSTQP